MTFQPSLTHELNNYTTNLMPENFISYLDLVERRYTVCAWLFCSLHNHPNSSDRLFYLDGVDASWNSQECLFISKQGYRTKNKSPGLSEHTTDSWRSRSVGVAFVLQPKEDCPLVNAFASSLAIKTPCPQLSSSTPSWILNSKGTLSC